MTPQLLRRLIANPPEHPPFTAALEQHLENGTSTAPTAWYRSQRERWMGWLA
jgi:hypothetical protein